ncbi:hypothetical protein FMM56_00950 [Campylobacter sp. LR264d]|uniref:hypothetical protein n=1 Tax=Campylobacter sp. LR264d TaxID=2593544 RepID=UPI00123AA70C|nr:hypothetical protein [Campylobacter sp. LR264d]KAA6234353.1 hypothetical protein FMM56_00950 [Campylobacter sp. LR264d]
MILLNKLNDFENKQNTLDALLNDLQNKISEEALNLVFKSAFENEKDSFLNEIIKQNQTLLSNEQNSLNNELQNTLISLFNDNLENILKGFKDDESLKENFLKLFENFLNNNKTSLLKEFLKNLDLSDFNALKDEKSKDLENSLNDFKQELTQLLLNIDSSKEFQNLTKDYLKENGENLFKNIDFSFLKTQILKNNDFKNYIKANLRAVINDKLSYKILKDFIIKALKEDAKKVFDESLALHEIINKRFEASLHLEAMNLQSELAMLSKNLNYINDLNLAQKRANDIKNNNIINKTYEVQ